MYSYEEAFQASMEYFQGEELSAKVFVDKYALRDNNNNILEKTPDEMHRRLAKEFARIEAKKFKKPYSEEFIYNLFKNYSVIIPQGSPIMGIGNPHSYVTLSNCYVLTTPEDSYNSILMTDRELVNISKRRGGVGINLSKLRPAGDSTNNAARTSTGISSWMERYSNSIREVAQNGRRGALMLTLSVHHPDIETFITIKNDKTKVTGANISVMLTDEFLNAVKKNEEFELRFPVDSDKPKISKKVSAKKIWDLIIKNAHAMAEPGLLFWDNIIKESPADCYKENGFETVSTNPCLPYTSKVLTKNGLKNIGEILVGDIIWSKSGWTTVVNKYNQGIKKVYKYHTTFNNFSSTDDHRILSNNRIINIKNASKLDLLRGTDQQCITLNNKIIMDGLMIGDGTYHKASKTLLLCIGKNDNDYFNSEIKNLILKNKHSIQDYGWSVDTSITPEELNYTYNRKVPDRFLYGDSSIICSFLRGIYSANGSICGDRITLKSASFTLIEQVQLMLNSIGILSYYTINKPSQVKFSNGEYLCKQSYDLNITRDKHKFAEKIGFIQQYKNEKLCFLLKNLNKCDKPEILSKDIIKTEYLGEEEVFDITVDNDSHTFWCNGINISNCSEIPLSILDSCRLMAINLFSCVVNPFEKNAFYNYKLLYLYSQIAQRLMDDLIDLELECIDRILKKIKSDPESETIKREEYDLWYSIRQNCVVGRRTGLGPTVLGDTLAALNIKYGSNESIETVEEIYKTLKFGAYQSSADIAKELGPFLCWDKELEKDNLFLNRFKEETQLLIKQKKSDDYIDALNGHEIWSNIRKHGRRNIALLTTAPTGTISTQASIKVGDKLYFNTTAGIEPLFKTHYTRRKKGNPGDKNFKSDFIDQKGDHWQEFDVYHSGVQAWMAITGKDKIDKTCPYVGCTAEEINWVQRVKLQAAAQKHIDHAISSTINLPEDVTEEEVAKIYEAAWKSGLKGITVYRANCRTGVLIEKKEFKRPKELPCAVHHVTVKNQQYLVLVGMMNDKPYETFACKNGILDKNIKAGKIIRLKSNLYKAVFDDETELSPITASCSEYEETISRLTSLALRNGTDFIHIIDQLNKVQGDMTSYAKCIARVLKKYVKDGTKSLEDCPDCATKLVFSEGCLKCLGCGYSKCS